MHKCDKQIAMQLLVTHTNRTVQPSCTQTTVDQYRLLGSCIHRDPKASMAIRTWDRTNWENWNEKPRLDLGSKEWLRKYLRYGRPTFSVSIVPDRLTRFSLWTSIGTFKAVKWWEHLRSGSIECTSRPLPNTIIDRLAEPQLFVSSTRVLKTESFS